MTMQIVVLGGGYGGVAFIRQMAALRPEAKVTLIDRRAHHTVLTEIHQVAGGNRAPESLLVPFASLEGCRFLQAEVTGLDPAARQVQTSAGPVAYDILVIGLGSVDTDYGVPGVRQHAMTLHSISDALAIRKALEALPEGAPVIVAGGGLTGVELAAEIGIRRGMGGNLTLVEAAPSLLPGLAPRLQKGARRRLGALGVNVLTATRIAAANPGMLRFSDGSSLPFGLMIWACGVRANPLIGRLGILTDKAGRAVVDSNMQTELEGVYVVGDCAAGAPPSAQAACQQGAALAVHIAGLLTGAAPPVRPVRMKGTLVDLGHTYGVGDLGQLQLTGWLPALLKRANVARWVWTADSLPAAARYFLGLDGGSAPAGERINQQSAG